MSTEQNTPANEGGGQNQSSGNDALRGMILDLPVEPATTPAPPANEGGGTEQKPENQNGQQQPPSEQQKPNEQQTPVTLTEADIERLVSERISKISEGKAKSFDEYATLKAEEGRKALPDFMQKMLAKYPNGAPDFAEFQRMYSLSSMDETKLDDMAAIRTRIQMDNPGRDDKWIDREMKLTVPKAADIKSIEARLAEMDKDDEGRPELERSLEDAREEEAMRLHRIEKLAQEARTAIKSGREAIQWPDHAAANEAAQKMAAERRGQFTDALTQTKEALKELQFKVNGHDFKFSTDAAGLEPAAKFAEQLWDGEWAAKYLSEDGKSFDIQALMRDNYVLSNLPNILDAVAKDASARAIAEHVQKMENAGRPGTETKPVTPEGGAQPLSEAEKYNQRVREMILP